MGRFNTTKRHSLRLRAGWLAAAGALCLAAAPALAGGAAIRQLTADIEQAINALPPGATNCEIEALVQRILAHADVDAMIELLAIAAVQAGGAVDSRAYDALTAVDSNQPPGEAGYRPDTPLTTSCDPVEEPPVPATPTPPAPEPPVEPPAPEPDPTPVPPEPTPAPPPLPPSGVDILVRGIGGETRRLPRNATQCEYEAAIRAYLSRSGRPYDDQLAGLRRFRATVTQGVALRRAVAYVIANIPDDPTGYSPRTGVGDNQIYLCGRRDIPEPGGPPNPPLVPGGGSSDY